MTQRIDQLGRPRLSRRGKACGMIRKGVSHTQTPPAPFRGSMRFLRSRLVERKGSPEYNVKAVEEHLGHTKALPDERVLVTLADGRSFVMDSERLAPQGDGTYLVALNDTDRFQLSRSQARDLDDASSGKRYV